MLDKKCWITVSDKAIETHLRASRMENNSGFIKKNEMKIFKTKQNEKSKN